MTLFWRIFIWAAVVPVAFILYFQLKNECEPKKNIIVGVTLPYSARYDPEVQALLERYKRGIKRACWASLAAVVPCLFVGSVGAQIVLMTIWIIALCVVLYLPYIRTREIGRNAAGLAAGGRAPGGHGSEGRGGGDALALPLVVPAAPAHQPDSSAL